MKVSIRKRSGRTEFQVSRAFWDNTTRRYWGRKPAVIKRPFQSPVLTADEAFLSSLIARKQIRTRASSNIRFFVNTRQQLSDLEDYLPEKRDSTLFKYAKRMQNRVSAEEGFVFTIADYQKYDPNFWLRTRDFLKGLYARTGLPSGFTTSELYFGNCSVTPFGVHNDSFDVFCFVIEGVKRMRFWPEELIQKKIRKRNPSRYEDLIRDGIVLTAHRGDLLYWPASYWHIAESDGNFTLSIHLGIGTRVNDPSWQFHEVLGNIIRRRVQASGDTGSFNIDETELQLQMEKFRLDRITSYAFEDLPVPETGVLKDKYFIRGDSRHPILMSEFSKTSELICSGNGTSFLVPRDSRLIRMIQQLNSGQPLQIAGLLQPFQGPDRREIRFILLAFYRARAITLSD